MPELPEVETVRRELEKTLVGKVFARPQVFYKPLVKTDYQSYLKGLEHSQVLRVSRKGKYLSFHLSNQHQVLFHLRMEGKLFVVDQKQHSTSHLSLYIPFENDSQALAFYDVRKFGVSYYLAENELGPLAKLGKEPSEIKDPNEVYALFHASAKPLKELLMDQTLMSGIGNIYADEICFASRLSPFKKGKDLSLEDCQTILKNSQQILATAIANHGSMVRSYRASQEVSGSYQENLASYGKEGQLCETCKTFRIAKVQQGGRGTCYCPKCQSTGLTVAVTGKIGSGKSLVLSYFQEDGYLTFSADECVHRLYKDKVFLAKLRKAFPSVVGGRLRKKALTLKLVKDARFRRAYTTFINHAVIDKAYQFIIDHDGQNKALEVPLLFESGLDQAASYLVGVETTRQKEHLEERGDKNIESRMAFNKLNSYDKNRYRLDTILTTDGTKEELKAKVDKLVNQLEAKLHG
jgi:formamidopyrimidine-DNA glycosylase